jgi:hypothetical protein
MRPKFDWALALRRWAKGALTGATGGYGFEHLFVAYGDYQRYGWLFIALGAGTGLLAAVQTDIDAYRKAIKESA